MANHSLLALAHFIVDIDRPDRAAAEQAKLPESGRLDDRDEQQAGSASTLKVVHS